jgi:mycothiol synthase
MPRPADRAALEAIWTASQDADDPAFRPRGGWWSLGDWADASRLLLEDGLTVGVAAVARAADPDAVEARIALRPGRRRAQAARLLVEVTVELAREAGRSGVLLVVPSAATWATVAVARRGFRPIRTTRAMLRPAEAVALAARPIEGVRIRRLRAGQEPAVLAALNRAWAGTWNYRPLTAAALAADLRGQREGFLVAVAEADETLVAGTVHALFDPAHRNPDGQPYAWISNLTTDPAWRGRGLGRALLAAGLDHLRARGAGSVALGVDGGDPVATALYRSAGFATIGSLEHWRGHIEG